MASIRTYGQGSSPRRRTSFSRSTNTSCQPDLKGSSMTFPRTPTCKPNQERSGRILESQIINKIENFTLTKVLLGGFSGPKFSEVCMTLDSSTQTGDEGRTGSTAILFAGQPVGDIKLLDLDAFRICDVSYWGTEPSRHCSGLTTGLTVESEKILRSKPADQYIVLAVAKKLAGVVVAAAECY
nr:hypothetical protein Iba_chr06aCG16800 [Ipomoea batatas]